ncbi:hypothetical protein GCM10023170_003400 [Phytohabitans houttuyneae]|uniref:GntR C-terminal domain-containing protein n=1 Tax=Phytohabitans houttuyneae TaxID=1076126 RepID=A0A6V8K5B8_9ACTN|nr:hypothetical protein Phou_028800 [Phytohabitans houttuyneae]
MREALRLLASQHLIVTTRGVTGGSFVAHPSPQDLSDTLSTGLNLLISTATAGLCDLLEVRESLEVPAAAQAARRRTEGHIAELEAALLDPAEMDVTALLATHKAFHAALVAATGNPLFELLSRPLYQVSNEREVAATAPPGFWQQVDLDHRELLRCVKAQDAEGATKVAREHITFIRTALVPPD